MARKPVKSGIARTRDQVLEADKAHWRKVRAERRYLLRKAWRARDLVRRVWAECRAIGLSDNAIHALLHSRQGDEVRRRLRAGEPFRRGEVTVEGPALEGMLRALDVWRLERTNHMRALAVIDAGGTYREAMPQEQGAIRRLVSGMRGVDRRRKKSKTRPTRGA